MSTPAFPGAVDPVDRLAELRTLSEQIPRFMRLIHALKNQAAKTDGGDRAALVLLFPLARLGPLRQGTPTRRPSAGTSPSSSSGGWSVVSPTRPTAGPAGSSSPTTARRRWRRCAASGRASSSG